MKQISGVVSYEMRSKLMDELQARSSYILASSENMGRIEPTTAESHDQKLKPQSLSVQSPFESMQ